MICSWKRANLSNHSLVMSNLSESLKSLFKKDRMKSNRSDSLLGIKRGKTKTYKNMNFSWNRSFFASDLLESRASHSHQSFLKSDESNSLMFLFCKEWREQIAQGRFLKWVILSKRAKSKWAKERIPNPAQNINQVHWHFSIVNITLD